MGQIVKDVIKRDLLYLDWCIANHETFILAEEAVFLCVEEIMKVLHDSSVEVKEAFVNNFNSNCKKKRTLYLLQNKSGIPPNNSSNSYDQFDDSDDEYMSNSRYNFVRDVLGGDPSAIWNID